SLSTMAGGVSLGATSPSQTVISSIFGSSAVMIGRSGTGGNGRGSNLANTRDAPLWISESDAGGPSKEKSTLLGSTPWATSALPLQGTSTVSTPAALLKRCLVSLVVIVPAP